MSDKRIVVVGLDAVSFELLKFLLRKYELPGFRYFFEQGAANEMVPAFPAWTPTNWATLITGAWPGTHSAPDWHVRADGRSLSTFDSRAITAETIFEAAGRQGLVSGAIHYPATMPRRSELELMVDGHGQPAYGSCPWEITPAQCYTTLDLPQAVKIELRPAEGWAVAPESGVDLLETPLEIVPKSEGRPRQVWLIVGGGTEYDRAWVYEDKATGQPLAEVAVGEWSEWAALEFDMPTGQAKALMRFKLVELSLDGKRLRLYRSQVWPERGWTDPDELGPELTAAVGPYIEHASEVPSTLGWTDFETAMEEGREQVLWIAEAFKYLADEHDARILYCHWHWPDHAGHHHLSAVDPAGPHYSPEAAEEHEAKLLAGYQAADQALQRLLEWRDERTFIAVVSDHGNAPDRWACNLNRRLAEVGLLEFDGDGKIDWERTQAYWQGGLWVWVNLAGRQERGIVPAEQVGDVVRRVLDALLDWRAPDGSRAVAFALPREHAAIIGMWGEQVGDVVFCYNPGFAWGNPEGGSIGEPGWYAAHHGPQMPTTRTGASGVPGAWLMVGPGVKRGYRRPAELGPLRTVDFVPTACWLLGIEPPAQSQGAVARDLVEGHEETRALSLAGAEPQAPARVWVQRDMHDFSPIERKRQGGRSDA